MVSLILTGTLPCITMFRTSANPTGNTSTVCTVMGMPGSSLQWSINIIYNFRNCVIQIRSSGGKANGGSCLIWKECKYCNEEFTVQPHRLKAGKGKYCSTKCAYLGRRKIIKVICETCRKEFKRQSSRIIGHVYCSHKYSEPAKTSVNHPNWKGGYSGYGTGFTKRLKEQIRKRDNYTCQECNYPEEELEEMLSIHHIDYSKNNHNIDNLISLCRSCHAKTSFNRDDWTKYYKRKAV